MSIVATVLNEADNVDEWLDGLLAQTRKPDEIIIVDGGSTDETVQILERRATHSATSIQILSAHGANISQGRNLGIHLASSDLIAVTDAGTRADSHWLERLIAPMASGEADVAAGFFEPRLDTWWQRALAASTLPDVEEIEPASFLPSSRSMAFHRDWFRVGLRYPEWLDYCEDVVWDLAMRRAGARFAFVPDAVVVFDVRPSAAAFARQYYCYARGDGKAGLFARRHAIRYVTYVGLLAVLLRRRSADLVFVGLLGAGYVYRPVVRLLGRDRRHSRPITHTVGPIPVVVILRALGDIAKMAGYPAGLAWRWKRYGSIGWRTGWRRISPDGTIFRPAASTRESPSLPGSRVDESRAGSR